MKDECEMNANMHTKYIESTGYFVLYARAPCLTLCASTETHTRPTILKMWTSEGISETQLTLLAYQKPRYLAINRNKPKWPIHCSLVRIQWGCSPFNHRSSLWPSSEPKFHNSQTIALWLYKFHCFFFLVSLVAWLWYLNFPFAVHRKTSIYTTRDLVESLCMWKFS